MFYKNKAFIAFLLVLTFFVSTIPPVAWSGDYGLNATIEVKGDQINIIGKTAENSLVSILVNRNIDGSIRYSNQTKSDEKGNFSYNLSLRGGDYRVTLASNGLYFQKDIEVRTTETKIVTVRVEGLTKTLLPETEVSILAGETPLLKAIQSALDKNKVPYEMKNGLLDTIAGEEGWQWMINKQGGMHLPTTPLKGGEEIILISDVIWDPIITRLTVPQKEVRVDKEFTVTLEQYNGSEFIALPNKLVTFDNKTEYTDAEGQVSFIPIYQGQFNINSEPGDNFIRPVPILLTASNTGGGGGKDDNVDDGKVKVYIRIEGSKKAVLPRKEVKVDIFSLDPYLGPADGSSATPSKGWGKNRFSKPTAAHATILALEEAGIDYDFQDYGWGCYMAMIAGEREKDYKATSGWLYKVNGNLPGVGCQAYKLKDGDEIYWFFAIDGVDYVGGGSGKGGVDSSVINPEYQEANDIINDPKATEEEIIKAIKDIIDNLTNLVNKVNKIEDAVQVLKDLEYIGKLLDKSIDKIDKADLINELAKNYNNIWESLGKIANILKDAEENKELQKVIEQNIDYSEKLMGKITNMGQISELISNIIDNVAKVTNKSLDLDKKIVFLTNKALLKVGTKDLTKDNYTMYGSKALVSIKYPDLEPVVSDIVKERRQLKQKLKEHNINIDKDLENKVTINIADAKQIETKIEKGTLEKILARGIENLEIKTSIATNNFSKNTLGNSYQGEEIILKTSQVDHNSVANSAVVPSGSPLIDIELKVGGQKVSELKAPLEITIPYNIDIKKCEKVTVFYLKDNGDIEAMGGVYDNKTKTVKFLTNHLSKFFIKENSKTFIDLEESAWAKDVIETMAGKGLIAGRSRTHFDPQAQVTRAEFAALVTRMLKVTSQGNIVNEFQDVSKDQWYKDSVYLAVENGLMNGKGAGIFDPEGQITRQEMAAVIANVLKQNGYIQTNNTSIDFKDKDKIADWAKDSVALTVREGVIAGMGDNTFAPEVKATRAQAAAMLYRLYDLLLK